jgi:hypothetical protein
MRHSASLTSNQRQSALSSPMPIDESANPRTKRTSLARRISTSRRTSRPTIVTVVTSMNQRESATVSGTAPAASAAP